MPAAHEAEPSASRLVLALLAVTQFLMTVDATVMNVSIGALVEDFDTSVTAIQGVITTYTLVMAASMITGGKLGDILGRRRSLRIGLVVYGTGSALTAVSSNVFVLLIGWSVLEGLGAALIMPTIVALIAGNFTGAARGGAYGTIAASSAVAVAAGPIIGGFVTSNFSWRWVFVAEVLIAAGIFVLSGRIHDVTTESKPQLDLIGAALSASGLTLVVFAVLQSSSWGWATPKVPDGDEATPALGGISLTSWLLGVGLVFLWAFTLWLHHRKRNGEEPLFDPDLLENRQLRSGLTVLMIQYIVSTGVFFMVPLFLGIVLGLDELETGLRMLPLSIALIVVAPAVPKFWPTAPPRLVVRAGMITVSAAAALLAVLLEEGADAGIVTVPFLLMGGGFGLLASQMGNVIVSSEPEERSSEVGGLQYTAQNLGSSLGTAVIGAVVIGGLAGIFVDDLSQDPAISAATAEAVSIELEGGAEFVSNAQLEESLEAADLDPAVTEAFLDANDSARIRSLQLGAIVAAVLALLGLFPTRRIPNEPL